MMTSSLRKDYYYNYFIYTTVSYVWEARVATG